jgi:hypothetical protein
MTRAPAAVRLAHNTSVLAKAAGVVAIAAAIRVAGQAAGAVQ